MGPPRPPPGIDGSTARLIFLLLYSLVVIFFKLGAGTLFDDEEGYDDC